MEKIAFRGDGTEETGRKIIETLEKMGGRNQFELEGTITTDPYSIDEFGEITNTPVSLKYRILTIEQYEAEQAQKEPLDLTKILEGCEGVELWCTVVGKVKLISISWVGNYPIRIQGDDIKMVTEDGRWLADKPNGECVLFPSKDNRDWSTFKRPAKVIFTNCVGEVFTQEDKDNDVVVWWLNENKICSAGIGCMKTFGASSNRETSDIFKSKKSLLLWLAEQEEDE